MQPPETDPAIGPTSSPPSGCRRGAANCPRSRSPWRPPPARRRRASAAAVARTSSASPGIIADSLPVHDAILSGGRAPGGWARQQSIRARRLARLCTGRNSSTCGSIARMPCDFGSNPLQRNSGFSQTSRRQERCSRSMFSASAAARAVAVQPVGDQQHHRALAEHAARPEAVERRPAPRRCGCRRTSRARQWATIWNATSGSRWRSWRVMLVSRVPNRNTCTRSRSLVTACRKCSRICAYRAIEPEMSHSTTSGGGRVLRRLRAIVRISPPWRRLARMVRRRSVTGPSGSGRSRRVRRRSSGRVSRRISRLAAVDLGGAHRLEIHPLQPLLVGDGEHGVLHRRVLLRLRRRALRGHRLGDAAAAGAGAFAPLVLLRLQQCHRRGLKRGGRVAPEQREGLVEHLLMLVAVHHRGAQRGARLGLAGEVDPGQRLLRGERLGRPDRQPGAAQQPREVQHVGRQRRGRQRRGRQRRGRQRRGRQRRGRQRRGRQRRGRQRRGRQRRGRQRCGVRHRRGGHWARLRRGARWRRWQGGGHGAVQMG